MNRERTISRFEHYYFRIETFILFEDRNFDIEKAEHCSSEIVVLDSRNHARHSMAEKFLAQAQAANEHFSTNKKSFSSLV